MTDRRFDVVLFGTALVVWAFYLMVHAVGWSFFGEGPAGPWDLYPWLYTLASDGLVLWVGLVLIALGLGLSIPLFRAGKEDATLPDAGDASDTSPDVMITRLEKLAFCSFLLVDVVAAGLLLLDVLPLALAVWARHLQPNAWFYVYSGFLGLSLLAFMAYVFLHRDTL